MLMSIFAASSHAHLFFILVIKECGHGFDAALFRNILKRAKQTYCKMDGQSLLHPG